jgi:hypothetical protein
LRRGFVVDVEVFVFLALCWETKDRLQSAQRIATRRTDQRSRHWLIFGLANWLKELRQLSFGSEYWGSLGDLNVLTRVARTQNSWNASESDAQHDIDIEVACIARN